MMGYLSMILLHAAHHAPALPTKEDGRWRISALQHFLDAHPAIPLVTTRKLRRILDELEEHTGENLTHAIDTSVEILEKERIINTITHEFEDMRESLAAKIDALGAEIAVRKQAEHELRMLNEELERRVEQRTAEIARQKYILDSFMANIPDSVYFKDRGSRMMQINHAMAKRLDLETPEDVVGKTDFDFFPLEQAQPKFDQEQEIIHHGKAVLALEEPDTGGSWSLTTKMPWRDEHGDIIGIFGISRDITDLKQAQQQLEDAYVEIKVLNDRLEKENFRMSAELDVARRLQEMVLPGRQELQELKGVHVAGFMRPADEIGGDYYDILSQHDRLTIGIGDVTGHGLESGVLMLMTQTAIRTLFEYGETDPVVIVNTLNRAIYKNVQRMGTEKSLTFALLTYQDGRLQLVGQHEEILVVRHSGRIERIDTKDLGLPIGLEHDIAQWVSSSTINLASGDGIVLYTDGITEAENMQREFYGIERMCDVVSRNWARSPEQIQQAVIEDVLQHIGEQEIYDDLTLVVLKQR